MRIFIALLVILIIGGFAMLHDVDKENGNRIKPTLKTADESVQRKAFNTNSTSYKNGSDERSQRLVFDNDSITTYDSDNVPSSVYGQFPDISDNPVLRVAKPGYDAETTGPENLIFNSEQNVFKVLASGKATLSLPSTGSPNYTVSSGGTP